MLGACLAAKAQAPRVQSYASYVWRDSILHRDSITYTYDTTRHRHHIVSLTTSEKWYGFAKDTTYISYIYLRHMDAHGRLTSIEQYRADSVSGTMRYSQTTYKRHGRQVTIRNLAPDTAIYALISRWKKMDRHGNVIMDSTTDYFPNVYVHSLGFRRYDQYARQIYQQHTSESIRTRNDTRADSTFYDKRQLIAKTVHYQIDTSGYVPWEKRYYTHLPDGDLAIDSLHDFETYFSHYSYDTLHRLVADTTFLIDKYAEDYKRRIQVYTIHSYAYDGWHDTLITESSLRHGAIQSGKRIQARYDQHGFLLSRTEQRWDLSTDYEWRTYSTNQYHYYDMGAASQSIIQSLYGQNIDDFYANIRALLPATGRIHVYVHDTKGNISSQWIEHVHDRHYIRTIEIAGMDDDYITISTRRGMVFGSAGLCRGDY